MYLKKQKKQKKICFLAKLQKIHDIDVIRCKKSNNF